MEFLETYVPLLGGMAVLFWMVYRMYVRVDREAAEAKEANDFPKSPEEYVKNPPRTPFDFFTPEDREWFKAWGKLKIENWLEEEKLPTEKQDPMENLLQRLQKCSRPVFTITSFTQPYRVAYNFHIENVPAGLTVTPVELNVLRDRIEDYAKKSRGNLSALDLYNEVRVQFQKAIDTGKMPELPKDKDYYLAHCVEIDPQARWENPNCFVSPEEYPRWEAWKVINQVA